MLALSPEEDEKEVLATDKTMIRNGGDVTVATIPSALMKNPKVKNCKGLKVDINLVKRQGRYFFEIELPWQISFDGKQLEVKGKGKT